MRVRIRMKGGAEKTFPLKVAKALVEKGKADFITEEVEEVETAVPEEYETRVMVPRRRGRPRKTVEE